MCGLQRVRSARDFVPASRSLSVLARAAESCQGCDLHRRATQTVFGEGPGRAALMLVGEMPGDQEDRQGHPFVGPAGGLLAKALASAGIERDEVYVTNVVKHFKWEPRGKRRLHRKPSSREIRACRPWLEAEIEAVAPRLIVSLGGTATSALLGRGILVTKSRGRVIESDWGPSVVPTYHPSAILRAPDASREPMRRALVHDFRVAARELCKRR